MSAMMHLGDGLAATSMVSDGKLGQEVDQRFGKSHQFRMSVMDVRHEVIGSAVGDTTGQAGDSSFGAEGILAEQLLEGSLGHGISYCNRNLNGVRGSTRVKIRTSSKDDVMTNSSLFSEALATVSANWTAKDAITSWHPVQAGRLVVRPKMHLQAGSVRACDFAHLTNQGVHNLWVSVRLAIVGQKSKLCDHRASVLLLEIQVTK